MAKEDMVLANKIKAILAQHHVDTKQLNLTVAKGSARFTGIVQRDDGEEIQTATMNVVVQKLEALKELRRTTYEFENMIYTGDSWVQVGRGRGNAANNRADDMMSALRIRQVFIGFRLDAAALNISVTHGVGRIYGRIQTESGEDVSLPVLTAAADKIAKLRGIVRCNYEFENMLRTGDVWVPINRRRRRDRHEAGGRLDP